MNKRRTHEQFLAKLSLVNKRVTVLDEYSLGSIKIRVKCNVDSHIWYATPTNLLSGRGCPKCADIKRLRLRKAIRHLVSSYNKEVDNPPKL